MLYWSSNNTEEILYAKKMVAEWNRLHVDQKIRFQPVPEGQSSEEVILAAVVGNTTPAIYSNMWQGDVEIYAKAEKLVKLDELEGFMDFLKDRCSDEVIKEITSADGHIYQIPWKINPIMMIYNINIFKQAGVTHPPRTYSEFYDAAKKIQTKDKNGYVNRWIAYMEVMVTWWQRFFDFYPLYLAASNGGSLVKDNKAAFDNKYAIETFQFIRNLFERKYLPLERLASKQDPFLSGQIAVRFTGPWEIAHAEKFKPNGFEYDFAPIPVPDDNLNYPYTYGDTKNIVIFNTCSNRQLAWQFLKEMLSAENDLELLKVTGQLPRRKDLLTNKIFVDYFNSHPKLMPFAKQSAFVRGTDLSENLKEVFDLISQEYEACVVYGKKAPKDAINSASFAINLLLKK